MKVELVEYAGGDVSHASSAWTSTNTSLTPERVAKIPTLLRKLAFGTDGNSHGTPFEKSYLRFLVTVDTATHIQLLKHRIAVSINAESARYKEYTEDKYHIPADWPENEQELLKAHMEQSFLLYHSTIESLERAGISRKRAKESARYFLPYGLEVNLDISFNFRSFLAFLDLRMAKGAQTEIRELASKMLLLVKTATNDSFQYSLEAFGL